MSQIRYWNQGWEYEKSIVNKGGWLDVSFTVLYFVNFYALNYLKERTIFIFCQEYFISIVRLKISFIINCKIKFHYNKIKYLKDL